MREENERAARESAATAASRVAPPPVPSVSFDRANPSSHLRDPRAGDPLPQRVVKSFPSRSDARRNASRAASLSGPAAEARRRADAARARRWKMVVAAVGGMTHADAACGTDAVFVAEPMTPARMFEVGVGPHARRSAASAQTGGDDDARDFETQTDVADRRAVAAQCPEDLAASRHQLEAETEAANASNAAGGATRAIPAVSTRRRRAAAAALRWARATGDLQHSKDRRLAGFVSRAGAVADVLLRERETAIAGDVMRVSPARGGGVKPGVTSGAPGGLSSAYAPLRVAALTDGRVATAAAFAPGARGARKLAVAYAPRDAKARGSAGMGLILVWDLAGAEPETVAALVAEGRPTRVAWGPGESHALIFCGTEEGAVCAWDLRETDEAHRAAAGALADEDRVRDGDRDRDEDGDGDGDGGARAAGRTSTAFRRPSYSTEGVFADVTNLDEEHLGAIVSLGVAVDAAESSSNDAEGGFGAGGGARDFHLVVLDCWGGARTYLAAEMNRREAEDIALTDAGLRFGSRVRLIPAARNIPYGGGGGGGAGGFARGARARDAALSRQPGAATEFFVARDDGRVLRGARYGTPPPPRSFVPRDPLDAGAGGGGGGGVGGFSPVASLHFNPTFPRAFLAAGEDGSVALYSTSSSVAVRRWDGVTAGKVVAVRWSPARPSAFFILDDRCFLSAFDLLSPTPSEPTHVEAFGKREKITSLEFADTAPEPGRDAGGGQRQHLFSLAYDDGRVDVHELAPNFAAATPEEVEATRAMLDA